MDLKKEVKLFMIFDILGDTERSGPIDWKIERTRLEAIKDHVFDLLLIARLLKKYFAGNINFELLNDYIMCHDLPEAITGDITKFEGVPAEEIKRVTNIAIDWLIEYFDDVLDFKTILENFENTTDIEAKIAHLIDRIHSATTFIKYQAERDIDMNKESIREDLRNHPFVLEKRALGKDLADIFFEYHMKSVRISDEECIKYNISREYADNIVNIIRTFAEEVYNQKVDGSLFAIKDEFPKQAMTYNRNIDKDYYRKDK